MPLGWRDDVTIGVSLEAYAYFQVKEHAGKRDVKILAIAFNNDTRPSADPRPAFAWRGIAGSEHGDNDSDILIKIARVCAYGDAVVLIPQPWVLNSTEQIGFKFIGENLDECNAKVLYEVVL